MLEISNEAQHAEMPELNRLLLEMCCLCHRCNSKIKFNTSYCELFIIHSFVFWFQDVVFIQILQLLKLTIQGPVSQNNLAQT